MDNMRLESGLQQQESIDMNFILAEITLYGEQT